MDNVEYALRLLDRTDAKMYDVRLGKSTARWISVRDNTVERSGESSDIALSVRVLKHTFGFAATTLLNKENIEHTVKKALKFANISSKYPHDIVELAPAQFSKVKESSNVHVDIDSTIPFLKDMAAKTHIDSAIVNPTASFSERTANTIFANSEGAFYSSVRQWFRVGLSVKAKGTAGLSVYGDSHDVVNHDPFIFDFDNMINSVSKAALSLANAPYLPAGKYKVVLNPDIAGVFAHEAIGHATEADSIISGESILKDRLGEKLAPDFVNLSDDPTLLEFGYYVADDEGVEAKKHYLIKDGILNEYLLDRRSAYALGMKPNGSARAQSAIHPPIVRMSNTFFEAGDRTYEELLDEVKSGILLDGVIGGTVNPMVGVFQFTCQRVVEIKNGELSEVYQPTNFSGNILTTLQDILAMSDKVEFSGGFCGKKDQSVPVGTGAPYILVRKATIGGK